MKAFIQPLQKMAEFEELSGKLGKKQGIVQISGCMDSQKAHLLYGLSPCSQSQLVIAADDQKARDLYEDYRFYSKSAMLYPGKDLLFYRTDIHGNLLIRQRMQVVKALLEGKNPVVFTSINGCMDYLRPLARIKESLIHLQSAAVIELEQLKKDLVSSGYERVAQVEMSGQFAVRGDIVDIYPLTEENPVRVELWGDEIDSIRSFDVESQRSLENL